MDRHGTHPTQLDQKDDRSQTTRLQGESFIIPDTLIIRTLNGES